MENANEDLSGCALDGHVGCARRSAEAARAHGDPELRGRVRQRPRGADRRPDRRRRQRPLQSHGVEWATKEHARQGSDYFGKVDGSNVAVMGQSCGTRQALEVSGDPHVKTTVLLNGGPGLGGGRGRGDVRHDSTRWTAAMRLTRRRCSPCPQSHRAPRPLALLLPWEQDHGCVLAGRQQGHAMRNCIITGCCGSGLWTAGISA